MAIPSLSTISYKDDFKSGKPMKKSMNLSFFP